MLDSFDLFGRLNVPTGRHEFDRYRAEIATGMQRALRVVLSVQDGGFFGGDRLEKFVELQKQSASTAVCATCPKPGASWFSSSIMVKPSISTIACTARKTN